MKLEIITHETAENLAWANRKWVVEFTLNDEHGEEDVLMAAPFLRGRDISTLSSGSVLCRSECQARALYDSIVGDDGPSYLNGYDGPARIYACLYSPDGKPVTENT